MYDSLHHKKCLGYLEEWLLFAWEVATIFVEDSWGMLCCCLSLYLQTEPVGSLTGWLCTHQPHQLCQSLQSCRTSSGGATTSPFQPWAGSAVSLFCQSRTYCPVQMGVIQLQHLPTTHEQSLTGSTGYLQRIWKLVLAFQGWYCPGFLTVSWRTGRSLM